MNNIISVNGHVYVACWGNESMSVVRRGHLGQQRLNQITYHPSIILDNPVFYEGISNTYGIVGGGGGLLTFDFTNRLSLCSEHMSQEFFIKPMYIYRK